MWLYNSGTQFIIAKKILLETSSVVEISSHTWKIIVKLEVLNYFMAFHIQNIFLLGFERNLDPVRKIVSPKCKNIFKNIKITK